MPYLQILQKYAYKGIFACRIHICDENSSKSQDFHEKLTRIEKNNGNFNFLVSLKLLSRISEKVRKYFLDRKEDKFRHFQILEKSVFAQEYQPMIKVIVHYLQILYKNILSWDFFACRIHICPKIKIQRFGPEKCKNIE